MINVRRTWSIWRALQALNLSHNAPVPSRNIILHPRSRSVMTSSMLDGTSSRDLENSREVDRYTITSEGLLDTTNNQTMLHFESRHCCKCPLCWNVHSNQITTAHTDETVQLTQILGDTEHFLHVEWSDGHRGQIATTGRGIYGNGVMDQPAEHDYQVTLRKAQLQKYWHDARDPELTKSFTWDQVMSCDQTAREFLVHFMVHGLVFLKDIPKGKNITEMVNKDIGCGPLWSTIFGEVSEVKSVVNPSNEAYGNEYLPCHIDLPYYTQPPSTYFFLCLKNECEGGESMWVDSFAILDQLRRDRPDYFEMLCDTEVVFRAYSPGLNNVHVVGSYPTVELSRAGDLYRVRDLFFVRDNYRMIRDTDPDTRARWWEAYSYFRRQIDNPKNQLIRKLDSQEMAIIDNWRVMHGRLKYKADDRESTKTRLMEVAYGDWNHLQSRILYQK